MKRTQRLLAMVLTGLRLGFAVAWVLAPIHFVEAHDIPNARVDRSTQVTLRPGRLEIEYEVSLAELTLTQELRALTGALPGGDRQEWFDAYGRETGPLNAKGFLVALNDEPLPLRVEGFSLRVEQHPLYTFRFAADLPESGHLTVSDTNFTSSEGTCRLGLVGRGVEVLGDHLPGDVSQIPAVPTWRLSDADERRTRHVQVDFKPGQTASPAPTESARQAESAARPQGESDALSRLLDRERGLSYAVILLMALGLGAVHALQPGHGKTLVAATAASERGGMASAAILGVSVTVTHMASVVLVAGALWWTRSSRFREIDVALTRGAGFLIAAIGLWRLGRQLGGYPAHAHDHEAQLTQPARRDLIGIGIAGGIVPCWDAVGLVVLSQAVGRLGLGLVMVVAFSVGMGLVLLAVGAAAARVRSSLERFEGMRAWEQGLGIASSLFLAAIGIYLLAR